MVISFFLSVILSNEFVFWSISQQRKYHKVALDQSENKNRRSTTRRWFLVFEISSGVWYFLQYALSKMGIPEGDIWMFHLRDSMRRSLMINLKTLKDGAQLEDDFWSLKYLQGSDTFCNMLSPKWRCLRMVMLLVIYLPSSSCIMISNLCKSSIGLTVLRAIKIL